MELDLQRSQVGATDAATFARMCAAAEILCAVVDEAFEAKRPPLSELIGEGPTLQWQHYPPDDLHDPASGVLIFYHAHSPDDREADEHGHFHCFVEAGAVPAGVQPLIRPRSGTARPLCHVAGLSVDRRGVPVSLFVPNQWVTGEWLYPAAVVRLLVDRFSRVGPKAPRPLRWVASILALHEPEIARLLELRDATLGDPPRLKRRAKYRSLEILAETRIDIDARLDEIADGQIRRADDPAS